ncbi:MAG: class I SAM-dependent methyltransferase [Gammaproteobacteria bacterium]|nr:class I SAM-dependent methyltransferase [Gammaproteobacteria bacterium]
MRSALTEALAGDHRSDAHRVRDRYRNPVETLAFFGLEPHFTVVELWPGAGWYTEVLAPVLRDGGQLVVANFTTDPEAGMVGRIGQALVDKLEAEPSVYDQVEVVTFSPPDQMSMGEAGTADLVLISRHFHNLLGRGIHEEVLASAYEALKSGGVLGVIQHRLPPDRDFDPEARIGYLPEAFVIEAAENAGFTFEARSDINANPMDTADHEMGVWALPPSLRACADIEDEAELTACRQRYQAIGESDRMTLKFVKP